MFKKIYYRYLLTFILGILFAHIAVSFLLAKSTSYFYKDFLINVRNFNSKNYMELAFAYVGEQIQRNKKPIMLVLGSSFTYGYSLRANETYSHYLADYFPEYAVANAAIIGDSGGNVLKILGDLKDKKQRVDTLIIELNLFNFTASSLDDRELVSYEKDKKWRLKTNSFLDFYLFHPLGLTALTNLDLNRFYLLGDKGEQKYAFVPLPDNYSQSYAVFAQKLPIYQSIIDHMLENASDVADHVYFFIAPIYANGVKQTQFKLNDIRQEMDALNAICKKRSAVHCLNPGLQFSEENFINISHFGEQGHLNLAKWLAEKIKEAKLL